MSYCDDCIILDICGKEGCCDEAMTFCADKHRFIHKSMIDKIRAEIEQTSETVDGFLMHDGTKRTVLQIINKYKAETE